MPDVAAAVVVRSRVRIPRVDGLRRTRLAERFCAPSGARLGMVVAPAGCGKTTLLAHLAECVDIPAAWLTLDTLAGDVPTFLAHLHVAVSTAVGVEEAEWTAVEPAVAALGEIAARRAFLLVLDDAHALTGKPAAAALRLLLDEQPDGLRVLLGSRVPLPVDVPRRRLAGDMWEIGADELRFRTWEIEALYRGSYGVRLRPDEVTALARGTGGWAAGLRMFQMATEGRPASERAQVLAGLGRGTRLTRRYLADHVLDAITAPLRDFLLRTSVLDELTGPRCDRLLDRHGSDALLAELEGRGLFTSLLEDGRTYRYHDVLRSHLLELLTTEFGAATVTALHNRAGQVLEEELALPEALRCYSRSGDWAAVRRLLGSDGPALARDPGSWLDLLPTSIRDNDPWVLLALARRLLAHGSLEAARDTYVRALEHPAAVPEAGAAAERRMLEAWLFPRPGRVVDAVHLGRAALRDVAVRTERVPPGDNGVAVAVASAHLLAGDLTAAEPLLRAVRDDPTPAPMLECVTLLYSAWSATLTGAEDPAPLLAQAMRAAALLRSPALTRAAEAMAVFAGGAESVPVEHLLADAASDDDVWGGAIVRLLAGFGLLGSAPEAEEWLTQAQHQLLDLDAAAPARWAAGGRALAAVRAGKRPDGDALALAESAGRAGQPLPYAMALLARGLSESSPRRRSSAIGEAVLLAGRYRAARWLQRYVPEADRPGAEPSPRDCRSSERQAEQERVATRSAPTPGRLTVQCLGRLVLAVDGAVLDLTGARPQVLELLRILAVHADVAVPREHLLEYVWPERDPARSAHSLQVAVSELRRLLEPGVRRGQGELLRREGGGYRLALRSPTDCDLRTLGQAAEAATRAHRDGHAEEGRRSDAEVLERYTGELLAGEDLGEWGVRERERIRSLVATSCLRLVNFHADAGDCATAATLARKGVQLAPYDDAMWRRLLRYEREAGNLLGAHTAEEEYSRLLDELGVTRSPTRR